MTRLQSKSASGVSAPGVLAANLESAEARYRAVFESASDAVLVADEAGHYLDANPAATRLLGYTQDELLGMSVPDVVAASRAWTEAEYARFLQDGRWRGELELACKDGSQITVDASAVRVPLRSESIYVSLLRDVSQRRAMEVALRLSDQRHRAFMESMAQGVLSQDATGRVVSANPAAERMLGASEEELRSRPPDESGWETIREDGSPFPADEYPGLIALRTGRHVPRVTVGVRNTAERAYRWLLVSAGPVRDEITNEIVGAYTTFDDISEHKRALDRLEESEGRFRSIATVLRASLIPPDLPSVPGVEVAASYRPAKADIGGDFYDVFPLRDSAWGIMIGDVRGKGAEAAAVTALARHSIRTAAMIERTPERVLRLLNEALLRDLASTRFCTAAFGRLVPREHGTFEVCVGVGGHPPPFVVRNSGRVEQVDVAGTLLGSFSEVDVGEKALCLYPGDKVVFYTDGLFDARRGEEFLAEESVLKLLEESTSSSAAELVSSLDELVADFGGGSVADDIAVLVLGVPPA